jgi:hypothetical protein
MIKYSWAVADRFVPDCKNEINVIKLIVCNWLEEIFCLNERGPL